MGLEIEMSSFIEYRSGYKYQLASDYALVINIIPDENKVSEFIHLDTTGKLTVKNGYAWDGTSGPVIDSDQNMRASLVHDALYQLMRQSLISQDNKKKADKVFRRLCKEDGVSGFVAQIYYLGLKIGGKRSTKPKNTKNINIAPESHSEANN